MPPANLPIVELVVSAQFATERPADSTKLVLWAQLEAVEARHRLTDDAETPRLPDAVLQGTRRLLRILEDTREMIPTLMTGTCDATVTLEWHAPAGPGTFRSLDVLSEDTAEEFVIPAAGRKSLRTVAF